MDLADLKKRVLRRKEALAADRLPWEKLWDDCARLVKPIRARYLKASTSGGVQTVNSKRPDVSNSKLLDTYGTWAWSILTSGMTSGLTSASRPWFKLETQDDDLMEYQAVKLWLAAVEARMYAALARSNFYTAAKTGYGSMAAFGIEAAVMVESFDNGLVTYPLSIGEYWIGLNAALEPDTLYRRCDMTVVQLYQRFVKERYGDSSKLPQQVRSDYDAGRYHNIHETYNAIEPNYERERGAMDGPNMPFRSTYWAGSTDDPANPFLEVSGFQEQPFWAPRWDVEGTDTYGTCPVMDARGDLNELQLNKLRRGEARDLIVTPALKAPFSMQDGMRALRPRSVNYMAPVDEGAFKPVWEVKPEVIGLLAQEQADNREAVNRHLHVDLFQAITQMDGVQPRNVEEILARQDEKMTQLGPVVERALNEKLRVALDRVFGIMMRRGEFPPPPDELHDMPLKITFVSVLAQLQRAQSIRQIERFAGYVGNLAGANPEALDKFDTDQSIDEYADATGVPPSVVRSDDQVEQIRKARAKEVAQAKAAEAAATAAPVAQQGAQAAKLLSETDAGDGTSMLQRVLGTG